METSNKRKMLRQRLKSLALLFLFVSPVIWLTACIQPKAVFEPFSIVNVQIQPDFVQGPDPVAGIRVSLTATGLIPGDNDFAFTDTSGFAAIRTQSTGFHYVVARHALYDVSYGGIADNLSLGGAFQVFQRGRIEIPGPASVVTPDYLFPFTGVDNFSQRSPKKLGVRRKKPGKARFIFFAEEGNIIRRTLQPTNTPQPVGKVFMTGSFNNFNLTTEDVDPINGAKELFDDGSFQVPDGDDQLGDGVFTRVLDLPPGEHTYMFLQNGAGIFTRDAHEEFSKDVRIGIRTPDNSIANPRVLEVREFRASAITVTSSLDMVKN